MKLLTVGIIAIAGACTWTNMSAMCVTTAHFPAQTGVQQIPAQTQPPQKQGKPVEALMLAKLNAAERVLEGLVTHDFPRIRSSAESLKLMSLDPPAGWEKRESDDEVYEHFRMEFMRQAARLEQMADDENLAGAAYYQQNLTATCIACHDYIRDFEQQK